MTSRKFYIYVWGGGIFKKINTSGLNSYDIGRILRNLTMWLIFRISARKKFVVLNQNKKSFLWFINCEKVLCKYFPRCIIESGRLRDRSGLWGLRTVVISDLKRRRGTENRNISVIFVLFSILTCKNMIRALSVYLNQNFVISSIHFSLKSFSHSCL